MNREHSRPNGSLYGASGCCELVRTKDWSQTKLGPLASWSPRLIATANLVLGSPHPMMLFWGPDHVQLYNDAFVPSLGPGRHPDVMGQRGEECWPEAWPTLGRVLEAARCGRPGWREDHLIPIVRAGRLEEAFWTYSYSPAYEDDGSVGGTLLVCTETTPRVLAERRARLLRELQARLAQASSAADVTPFAMEVLRGAAADVPFAAAYEVDANGAMSRRHSTIAVGADVLLTGERAPTSETPVLVDLPALELPGAAWRAPITRALVVRTQLREVIVFGLSPRRPFDVAYQEHLEHVIQMLAHERQRLELRSQAQAASRAKDEFLAMLGHELRNPLAPILTALHLMRLKDADALAREREIIARQASHLVKLVDDLLDVARVARGKVVLHRTRIDLGEVVARAVEMASPLFEQKRHVLTVDLPSEELEVDGDPLRLEQVFANLLTNAAKYTEPGGRIATIVRREEGLAVVRVEDNGVGIHPDQLPHVFDVFFQGPRSADRAQGGLGLGLALVKSFVTLHGGTVTATSREGGGSVFEVRLTALPACSERASEATVETPRASTGAGGGEHHRVLLVDDSEDILELIASLLRHEGYEVLALHDAPSALRAVQEFRPDVAVLDIGLPAMDGYELAAHLRETLGERTPRLIAMTGYGQEADRRRARRAGFSAHLVKPVDPQELLARVRGGPEEP